MNSNLLWSMDNTLIVLIKFEHFDVIKSHDEIFTRGQEMNWKRKRKEKLCLLEPKTLNNSSTVYCIHIWNRIERWRRTSRHNKWLVSLTKYFQFDIVIYEIESNVSNPRQWDNLSHDPINDGEMVSSIHFVFDIFVPPSEWIRFFFIKSFLNRSQSMNGNRTWNRNKSIVNRNRVVTVRLTNVNANGNHPW